MLYLIRYLLLLTWLCLEKKDKDAEWKMSIGIGVHLLDDAFAEARRRIDDYFCLAIEHIRHIETSRKDKV